MTKIILRILFLILAVDSFYQTPVSSQDAQSSAQTGNNASKKNFYQFYIPSVIDGSSLNPSPISNIGVDLAQSSIQMKLGTKIIPFIKKVDSTIFRGRHYRSLSKKTESKDPYGLTGFIQVTGTAADGVFTLYKTDNPALEGKVTGGLSYTFPATIWSLNRNNQKFRSKILGRNIVSKLSDTTTFRIKWISLRYQYRWNNYNIFNENETFDNLLTKSRIRGNHIMLSYNLFLQSILPDFKYKLLNSISSIGVGHAVMNNYNTLTKRDLETVRKEYFDKDSSTYKTLTETITGRLGPLVVDRGPFGLTEFFYPLHRIITEKKLPTWNVYLGFRGMWLKSQNRGMLSYYASGLYFNVKDASDKNTDPYKRKDKFSFAFVARIDEANKIGEDRIVESESDKFTFSDALNISLSAAFPLSF